ncbi:Uncharacterised protein [Chryseobacterium nakagawai]|uniref:DUF4421 domain-containing protein n=1 Tax=Chryseobacterium nakagawai TaxID=1241982 RepID=A0AAD1DRA5_CHRNA|nr:DUF4421 family protein [Chryseobacterium nakagawai]AZA91623.1 DUF4421 domain-containing protein [Chryseobacterium nakagawai]VEH18108.1 Uncharacterised protein [Chryseobacterium nakagawai]
MNLRKEVFVVLFLVLAIQANAQRDTTNIKSYADQVMIRANLDTNIESYIFTEGEKGNQKKQIFSINNKTKVSFSVDYRIISATVSFAPRFFAENKDNDLKGNSSYTDFSIRFFPKRLIQNLYYKNVKGFYIENMKELFPAWKEGDPYMQFPDLRVQSFGGSTAYILNKNFSARSIYTQGEWQNKSSGSWVPFLDYDLTILRNKVEDQNAKETQYKIGANMGYFYNWVLGKNVNIAPYFALGLGGKFSTYRDVFGDGSIKNVQYLTLRMEGGLHIGYNTDRFLFGGKMNFNAYAYNQTRNQTVENNSLYGLLYIGYRFAPPRVVKDTYDKVQKKIPVL